MGFCSERAAAGLGPSGLTKQILHQVKTSLCHAREQTEGPDLKVVPLETGAYILAGTGADQVVGFLCALSHVGPGVHLFHAPVSFPW